MVAANVAKEAYNLTKAAEQNMQKLYKEQEEQLKTPESYFFEIKKLKQL
ncbi:OspD family protein [Borreliella burgdorferi]